MWHESDFDLKFETFFGLNVFRGLFKARRNANTIFHSGMWNLLNTHGFIESHSNWCNMTFAEIYNKAVTNWCRMRHGGSSGEKRKSVRIKFQIWISRNSQAWSKYFSDWRCCFFPCRSQPFYINQKATNFLFSSTCFKSWIQQQQQQ